MVAGRVLWYLCWLLDPPAGVHAAARWDALPESATAALPWVDLKDPPRAMR
jgi:hypothetical protein